MTYITKAMLESENDLLRRKLNDLQKEIASLEEQIKIYQVFARTPMEELCKAIDAVSHVAVRIEDRRKREGR